ncbi:MAG: hypothetical protein ABFS14_07520 [Gemmatimonadota bacterium]
MTSEPPRPTLWRRFDRACVATPLDRRNMRRFLLWLVAWMAAFVAARLVLSGGPAGATPVRIAAAVGPSLIGIGCILAFASYLRQADELARRIQLESLAMAFGGGALFLVGYTLLEQVGLPSIRPPGVLAIMAMLWAVGTVATTQRYT